jgi:hypothetical protein
MENVISGRLLGGVIGGCLFKAADGAPRQLSDVKFHWQVDYFQLGRDSGAKSLLIE